MKDTSVSGGMYIDQINLIGAYEILKNRHRIDFKELYAGKISVEDLFKLSKQGIISKGSLTRQDRTPDVYERL